MHDQQPIAAAQVQADAGDVEVLGLHAQVLRPALARLNARLDRKIDLFKLAQRADMVARLAYDQRVVEAAMTHATETGVPGEVAFEEARRYAREIVPGFSATVYFGFGTRAAK